MNNFKKELIGEIKKRVADKILEPSNAELLEKLISKAESDNEAMSIAELGTTYKRTGLHFDKRLEKMSNAICYFERNKQLSFSTSKDAPTHKLIIGDNYKALQNLLIQYKNKIDVIYIDPPYGKDRMGEFAQTNYENAISRDNGLIFCSIDDKNQAYIKCLFDEVFGERNFIACIPRKTGAGDAATRSSSELRKPFDYLLLYKKSNDSILQKKIVGQKEYKYSDEFGNYKLDKFQASGSDSTRDARPNLYYPIYLLDDGSLVSEKYDNVVMEIFPKKVNGKDGRWMWKIEKFNQDKERYLYFDGNEIFRKTYYDSTEDQNKYQVEKAWIDGGEYRNAKGTVELQEILNEKKFDNPKPIALIDWCLNLFPIKEDSIILDFFAGSGSTGHAVLEQNKKDGGSRTFILCQLNEVTDSTPNGIAYDVTSKRLKRIMTGECYDGTKDFEWNKKYEPYGDNLEVYEVKNVATFEQTNSKTPFDVIDETLYGKSKFETLKEKVDWVCSNFSNTQKYIESENEWLKRIEEE